MSRLIKSVCRYISSTMRTDPDIGWGNMMMVIIKPMGMDLMEILMRHTQTK